MISSFTETLCLRLLATAGHGFILKFPTRNMRVKCRSRSQIAAQITSNSVLPRIEFARSRFIKGDMIYAV